MQNKRQEGESLYLPAPTGGVSSGDFVYVGAFFGIAGADAAEGQVVSVHNAGQIFSLPKAAEDWTVGVAIYWDAVNKVATKEANDGGDPVFNYGEIGVATALEPDYTAAALTADAVGDVRLNPAFRAAMPVPTP